MALVAGLVVTDDITALDAHFRTVAPGSDIEKRWRAVRAALQRAKRISSQSLPAVASSAQHFIAARDHINAGIEALGGITAGHVEPPLEDG